MPWRTDVVTEDVAPGYDVRAEFQDGLTAAR